MFFYELTGVDIEFENSFDKRKVYLSEYLEKSTLSWIDVAKAAYACSEASVLEILFNNVVKGKINFF